MMKTPRIVKVGGVCGIIGALLYIAVIAANQLLWPTTETTREYLALVASPQYSRLSLAMHFGIVPAFFLMIVAFIGLYRLLSSERASVAPGIGVIFGIIACGIMTQMSIIQGSVMVRLGKMFIATTDEIQREAVATLYKGLRTIDYGLDLAFDVFFFTAWIILGYAMLHHKSFGKIFGAIGIVLFVVTTILNLRTAPSPPTFDIGPIVVLWVLAVYVQMVRSAKSISEM